jgi:hypothetical protein
MKSKQRFWTHAQGMVEFALILPVLLLLILGVIEMGRLLAIYSGISSAARQAARYGSVGGDSDPAQANVQEYYLDCSGIRAVAKQASPLLPLTDDDISVGWDHGSGAVFGLCKIGHDDESPIPAVTSGDRLVVAITSSYRPLVPIVPIPELPLTFQAARTIFTSIIGPTPTPVCPSGPATGSNTYSSIASSFITQTVGLTATINVTIKNTSNCAQSGISVAMSGSGPGTATVASSPVTTTSGIATFVVSATVAGNYTFLATAPTGVSKSLPITFTAGSVYSGTSTLVASPTTVTADGMTTADVVVTLKDKYGNIVGAGKTVSLTSSRAITDTILWPGGNTSDSSGQVTFVVRTAMGATGTSVYTATATSPATSPAVVIAQTASVVYTASGVSVGTSTVVAQSNSLPANNSTTTVITVTLKDQFGGAVSGKTVSLTSSRGVTDTISLLNPPNTNVTNASGQVFFTVKSGKSGTSTYTARDTTDSITLTDTEDVTYSVGAVNAGTSTVVASPTSVQADGVSVSTVTVTLKDGTGNGVPGKVVTIASSRGATDTITTVSGTTNASGQATFTVKSSTTGTSTITATDTTDSNLAITPSSATITFITAGANAATSTLIASPTTVQADGSSFSTLVVTLKDSIGNPVAGKVVTIASSRPLSDTITTIVGTTNAAGQATFTVKSVYVGSSVYTATDTTDSPQVVVTQTATVNFVCVTGAPLGITSGSDQFVQVFFTNATGITRRLSSVTITWPDNPTSRQLNTTELESVLIWTGSGNNTSPITLSTADWNSTGTRVINNGFGKTLKLTYNFAVSSTGSFVIVASWDNNAGGSICTSPTVVVTP